MKKNGKILIMGLIICLVISMTGCYSACLKNSVSFSPKSNTQVISLSLVKGNKLRFDYESSVKQGTLKLELTDEKSKVIENFEVNKKGSKEIKFKKTGTYIISAAYKNFKGSYKVGVKQ